MALDGPLTSMVVQVIQSTTAALVGQVRYRGPQGPEFDAQGCSYSETAQKCSAVPRHGRVGRMPADLLEHLSPSRRLPDGASCRAEAWRLMQASRVSKAICCPGLGVSILPHRLACTTDPP